MQNEAKGTVSDSDKCEIYARLDKISLSRDSESEYDVPEAESPILGEDDKAKVSLSNGDGEVNYCIGDCQNEASTQSHIHPISQPQFEPEMPGKLVELLQQAVTASSDPEVIRRLTASVACALDEAAAALNRMRTDTTDGSNHQTNYFATYMESLVDSGSNNNFATSSISSSGSSGDSDSSSRSSSTSEEAPRTLIEACSDGDIIAAKKFIEEGRSVHETTEDGESLLSLTCSEGYFDLVQVLLEHGASVEDHNENGHTPLMEAAYAGHVDVAQLLLTRGAGINTSSSEFKESALTLACYKGHLEMVKFLLEAGADLEHKTDEMHTALMEASMGGHVDVAMLLLDSGAQVNMAAGSDESPLTLAACGGQSCHTELALLLLERGANIEEVNDDGYTPLMEAAREGHDEMVKLLIAHDADINAQTEETQETALTLACCGGFKEVAHTLIKFGGDLELGSSTPLMEAAQEGHKELVKFLLDIGCNPNSQTSSFDTALTYAAENGHTDVTIYLVRAGANIEHESEGGRTPLMKACWAGHYCTVQFLANQGADVNKTTAENDHTPLSLACVGGSFKIAEYLLAIGADPHHKLKDNSTMIMEASKGGHASIVKLLMDYPSSIAPIMTQLANQAAEAAALQAESMGTVVENSSAMAVNRAQEFALGLSVMASSDPQSSLGLNAANPMVVPDIGSSASDHERESHESLSASKIDD